MSDQQAKPNVPYAEQMLGPWLMEETIFQALKAHAESIDLAAHTYEPVQSVDGNGLSPYAYTEVREDGTAVVQIRGTMMKHASSFSAGTSTVRLRRDLRALADDPLVKSVVLHIESGGGTAAGTMELGNEVRRLSESKKVVAHIEDIGASAAYWVASQADEVFANQMAKVGSIGTYITVADYSKMAEQKGIKVHVLSTGDFKGAMTPGTEITEEHLSEVQDMVNKINMHFLTAVKNGRGMSAEAVDAVADGRVWMAVDALALGLLDGVQDFETTLERSRVMPTTSEYRAALPGVTSDQIISFIENDVSIESAKSKFIEELALQNEILQETVSIAEKGINERNAKISELESQIESMRSAPGVEPLEEVSEEPQSSALLEWKKLVKQQLDAGVDKAKAHSIVAKANPELRQRLIDEANS